MIGRAKLDVLITGGGTAGHLYPAIAIAAALERRGHPRASLLFVGARAGLERAILPSTGYRYVLLPGRGVRRRFTVANLLALIGLGVAFARALWIVGVDRPKVIVAVGGYGGVACALAGRVWGVPVVTVNVDAVVGAANRLIARFAKASTVPYPGASVPRAVVTGVPVREEILAVDRSAPGRDEVRARRGIGPGQQLVVVVGGSLGARRMNDVAVALRSRWAVRDDLVLHHICGTRELERMAAVPVPTGSLDYRLVGYEEQMADVLCAVDLLIGRSGAMTVAEVRATGVPSILVPLPGAPSDHQRHNAEALARLGGAIVVADADATGERVGDLADSLLGDQRRLDEMGQAARAGFTPDAAARIAELIDEVAAGHGGAR